MAPWGLLFAGLVFGDEPEADPVARGSVHGDVKSFFLAGVPRTEYGFDADSAALLEASGMSEAEALDAYGLGADPFGQGVASARLKGVVDVGDTLHAELHWAAVVQDRGAAGPSLGMGSGVGLTAPELIQGTWAPDVGSGLFVQHRVDRAVVAWAGPGVDVTAGRQPISFGAGRVFTPMDLVNPFHPATIDSEYKPGVDALRVDAYAGVASKLTVAVAYAGERPLVGEDRWSDADGAVAEALIGAAYGQVTVGVTDLALFVGAVHGEGVVGVGAVSSVGPVGVHAEGTLTVPGDGEDVFVRAVAGADLRPTGKSFLSGEVYLQTLGADAPSGYLDLAGGDRFARGELWQMGRFYAALSWAQEVTPLVSANASVIANLADPSALAVLGAGWSVADNAELGVGAYLGVGEAQDPLEFGLSVDPVSMAPVLTPPSEAEVAAGVQSEFGLYPTMGFLQVKAYF